MNRREFIQNMILAGFGVAVGIPALPAQAESKEETDWNPPGLADANIIKVSEKPVYRICGIDIAEGGGYVIVTMEYDGTITYAQCEIEYRECKMVAMGE